MVDPPLAGNAIVAAALCYVFLLFAFAWYVDQKAASGGAKWLHSPIIYTLSLSVYCTAWTFYGAVGSAARSGVEFMTIYLGPTLVFVGWWWLIRKLVRIGRIHRITSIADMISSRYGKSGTLAAIATLIAVIATTPYIALQLQSLTTSFEVITGTGAENDDRIAFWAAAMLALFTILFGTRSLDENERHHGVVAAIAAESVVKLTSLIAVGIFAVYGIAGGIEQTFADVTAESLRLEEAFGARWVTLLFLSASAIICLPRQFQVTVVENSDERHLATASWMFPLYLLLISFFVLPIAAVGAGVLPEGSNPDLFVLTLPLSQGNSMLTMLIFLGGLSASTSMVIVTTIALSTMVSNHIVSPLSLRFLTAKGSDHSGDVQRVLLSNRRIAIIVILALGYIYFRMSGRSEALAATGLIAFCGVAQFLPPLLAGIFWRNATRAGAISGLVVGFLIWTYALYLPSFSGEASPFQNIVENGPFGLEFLRPHALFGMEGSDPLIHATCWSVGLNSAILVLVSLLTWLTPLERVQSTLFVDVFRSEPLQTLSLIQWSAGSNDLFVLAKRILGTQHATWLFNSAAIEQGKTDGLPDATPVFVSRLERELAGSVGAASAHALVGGIAGGERVSMNELIEIADEHATLRRATDALRVKSEEAEQTASKLRNANRRLKEIDAQKDEFLSHVSHELRTPMTSVRSFAEILKDNPDLDHERRAHFAGIIQAESIRLTKLLDEIRDLNFLEDQDEIQTSEPIEAHAVLMKSVEIAVTPFKHLNVDLRWDELVHPVLTAIEGDRLSQVLINLTANAILHNDKSSRRITVSSSLSEGGKYYRVSIKDNGPGIPPELTKRIFEPFYRGTSHGSAGLGLPISDRILRRYGGSLSVKSDGTSGAEFIVSLPVYRSGEGWRSLEDSNPKPAD